MQIDEITAGESWGCRFRVRTFVDDQGRPVSTRNIPIGGKVPGEPGTYEGWGVIARRDRDRKLVEIEDAELKDQTWVVSWDDCWAVDRVEYLAPAAEDQQ